MKPLAGEEYYSLLLNWYGAILKRLGITANGMNEKQQKNCNLELAAAHLSFEKGLNVHAFFKTNNHEIGEDLVQDTFMKTWAYLAKGGKIDLMKSFLYHIFNNLIIDEYRKEKYKTVSLDHLMEKGFKPNIDNSEHLFNTLDGQKAFLLIKNLPKIYQKIMRLKYKDDLSLKEMSLLTGQSRNAIAVQTHRGLIKLKALYKLKLSDNHLH
jgi:RNA polymerase sigma factor, sigma-70 family